MCTDFLANFIGLVLACAIFGWFAYVSDHPVWLPLSCVAGLMAVIGAIEEWRDPGGWKRYLDENP